MPENVVPLVSLERQAALAEATQHARAIDKSANALRRHLGLSVRDLMALVEHFTAHEHSPCPGCDTCAGANPGVLAPQLDLAAMLVVTAKHMAVDARSAVQAGDAINAIRFAAIGQSMLVDAAGCCMGLAVVDSSKVEALAVSRQAQRAAASRHRENRDMRAQVVRHYQENRDSYRSKDAAAADMAGRLVPMPFRTVRDWLKSL